MMKQHGEYPNKFNQAHNEYLWCTRVLGMEHYTVVRILLEKYDITRKEWDAQLFFLIITSILA